MSNVSAADLVGMLGSMGFIPPDVAASAAANASPGPGGSGGITNEVDAALLRVIAAGVQLDAMAIQALASMKPEHALEMLEYVAENHMSLRNPSKYITSTVSRGFMPRRSGPYSSGPPAAPGGTAPQAVSITHAAGSGTPLGELERMRLQAQEFGLALTDEAFKALGGLAPEHSQELFEFVLEKHADLRDPSNYIASTVARGFKSRRIGGGVSFSASSAPYPAISNSVGGGGAYPVHAANGSELLATDTATIVSQGLQKLREQVGVELDDMAQRALQGLRPEQAREMLEYIFENHASLRNPSNYISSTVSRGFVSRKAGVFDAALPAKGKGKGKSEWGPSTVNQSMVPSDATQMERRILTLNSTSLGADQQISFATYMALRCVPSWQATELLDSIEAKSTVIASPCNYIQAAVSKIIRGQGFSSGYTTASVAGSAGGAMWSESAAAGGSYAVPVGAATSAASYAFSGVAAPSAPKRPRTW